jgi:hypothetical protein
MEPGMIAFSYSVTPSTECQLGSDHGIRIGILGKRNFEVRVAGILEDRVFLHDTTNGSESRLGRVALALLKRSNEYFH